MVPDTHHIPQRPWFPPPNVGREGLCEGTHLHAVYVDDLLIAGPSKEEIQKLKKALSKRFDMTDLGPCSYYLGMTITRDRKNRTIRLSQKE